MKGTSERVSLMREGFMEQHNQGKTISEIAEYFEVSTWSIYNSLQEIADKNGVERESLLRRVFTREETTESRKEQKQIIEPEKLLKDFHDARMKVRQLITTINKVVEEMQEEEEYGR